MYIFSNKKKIVYLRMVGAIRQGFKDKALNNVWPHKCGLYIFGVIYMYEKNKVIRKKIIFLSGSAKFSFAYPQYSHLHIRNFATLKLVLMPL